MIDTTGVLGTLAYAGVGLTLLTIGYVVLDLITPGNLRHLVFQERNTNAAVVAGANAVALTTIIVTAILESDDLIRVGLVQTVVYGLIGIALQAVAFKIIDIVTPGHLGHIVTDPRPDPASGVVAVFALAMGAVLAASIT
jgi:uncharacterized membrane protein YjfL (UPF0719 family)